MAAETEADAPAEDRVLVVIDGYVLDLTEFLEHHPAGKEKILEKMKEARAKDPAAAIPDISANFLDHYGHTVRKFRQSVKLFNEGKKPVTFTFKETPDAPVTITGRR